MPLTENFFDLGKFAGEGSVGHVVESGRRYFSWMIAIREPEIRLAPLTEADLPVLAYVQHTAVEELLPVLAESAAQSHEGCYYEQFTVRMDACVVGTASLFAHEDGTVSEGVEIFLPFRRCGLASKAMPLLMDVARQRGFVVMTAQVRTDNAASIALHRRLGFTPGEPWVNRRGREVRTWRKEL